MKPKMIGKIAVDIAMTVLLLLLMAKQLTGDVAHEWLGAGMFVLWIAHHALNFGWHRSLFRGKYMPVRVVQTVVNLLLLAAMLGTMVSAVILSREVFAFLPISGGIALARPMHIFCSFWSFVLMALHLGLHWNMVLGMFQKMVRIKKSSKIRSISTFIAGFAIAGYGVWVFISRDFPTYLFLKSEFVFLDYSEPKILFYIDYIALMGLCIFIAHYGLKLCRQIGGKRRQTK